MLNRICECGALTEDCHAFWCQNSKLTEVQRIMLREKSAKDCSENTECSVCGKPSASSECDWCWELEMRIKRTPDLARKIIKSLA